jgi:undecaprenyl-phosphate galactose phosphotransferase
MKHPPYKILLAVIDFIVLRLSFSAAMQLKGVSHVQGEMWKYYLVSPEFISFFFFSFCILLIFQSRNLYKINIVLTQMKQAVIVFICIAYAVIGLSAIAFFFRSPWIIDSRLAVAYFAGISFSAIVLYRVLIFTPLYIYFNKNTMTKKKVVIVGNGIPAKSFAVEMGIGNIYGFQLVGFVTDNAPVDTNIYENFKVLGKISDIGDVVSRYTVDEIIVAESGVNYDELMHIIDICKQTQAHINVASPLFEVVHKKFSVDSYFDLPIAPLKSVREEHYTWALKRFIDVVGSAVGLLILSVPLLLIAVLIKLSSRGPILYKQVRVGKNGKLFNFYKFRSMRMGSDQDQDRIVRMQNFIRGNNTNHNGSSKVINEKMVTPIGRFIRKTSLDEIPQLINVLRGEMSLVGPRPCLPYEYEAYDEWHKRRLSVLPGCTGLWQVSSRAEGGFDEMVVLDLYYIGNISPAFDIQLILKTIPVMIMGRGGK